MGAGEAMTTTSTNGRCATTTSTARRPPSRLSTTTTTTLGGDSDRCAMATSDGDSDGARGECDGARSECVRVKSARARSTSPTGVIHVDATTMKNDDDCDYDDDDGDHRRHNIPSCGRRVKTTAQLREALASERAYTNGAYDEALMRAERCVELAPYWYRGHLCAARCFFANREGDRAFEALERVLFLDPNLRADKEFREMYIELAQDGRC